MKNPHIKSTHITIAAAILAVGTAACSAAPAASQPAAADPAPTVGSAEGAPEQYREGLALIGQEQATSRASWTLTAFDPMAAPATLSLTVSNTSDAALELSSELFRVTTTGGVELPTVLTADETTLVPPGQTAEFTVAFEAAGDSTPDVLHIGTGSDTVAYDLVG